MIFDNLFDAEKPEAFMRYLGYELHKSDREVKGLKLVHLKDNTRYCVFFDYDNPRIIQSGTRYVLVTNSLTLLATEATIEGEARAHP